MDFKLLRLFLAVAESRSISVSARSLGVAQSLLSRQLAALEATLGAKLFLRTGRGVELTPAGRLLADWAVKLVKLSDQAVREVRAEAKGNAGALRLGYVPWLAHPWLAPAIRAWQRAEPTHSISLHSASSGELLQQLTAGAVDAIIVPQSPTPERRLFGSALLAELLLAFAVPRNHALARESSLSLRAVQTLPELRSEPMLIIANEDSLSCGRWTSDTIRKVAKRADPPRKLDSADTFFDQVAIGHGVGICAYYPRGLRRDDVVLIPVAETVLKVNLVLLWRLQSPPRNIESIASAFARALTEEAEDISSGKPKSGSVRRAVQRKRKHRP